MINLFVNRLYDLSINIFYKYSFFYFYIFALQKKFYYILKKENLKISYYNNPNLVISKKNQVYIFYNSYKYEIFSLSKILFNLNNLNNSNDNLFQTSLSFNSVLYNYYYFNNSIKYYYNTWCVFLKKNIQLLYKNMITPLLILKKRYILIYLFNFLKNKSKYYYLFLKRFYFFNL